MTVALIRMRRHLALAALSALFAGCSSGDITNPDQIVFAASNVSYAHDVAPYLQLSCNSAGCHDALSAAGGVDLTSWINVRNPHVTQPGDTTSPLVLVMFGKVQHNTDFRANDNQRNGIRTWVLEGAKNN